MNRRSFLSTGAVLASVATLRPEAARAAQRAAAREPGRRIETLTSARGVPAEIVGAFRDASVFAQAASGQYFVFDRTGHTVYGIDAALTGAWKIVQIGGESGRILDPTAFGLARNGSFVVADRPGGRERIQLFGVGGSLIGGFTLPGRPANAVSIDGVPVNGSGSLHYTGRTLLLNLPETGALVAEYSLSGSALRTFGTLRATGQEADRDVHLGLNGGLPLPIPGGGFYFVFRTGAPAFRKYDASGRFLFERRVQGVEVDEIVNELPTSWRRRKVGDASLPVIPPIIRTAAVDPSGDLWISFAGVPFTYVYDASGEKVRVVRFQAAGTLTPSSLFFSHTGRLLVAPGCFEFSVARR